MKPILFFISLLIVTTSLCQPTGYRGVRLNGSLMTYETFVYNSPGILPTNSYLTSREKDSLYFAMFYKSVRIDYLGSSIPVYIHTDAVGNLIKSPVTDIFDPLQYYDKTQSDARYLQSFTEMDPLFILSPSFGITGTQVTNWDNAFLWGNHALAGYATAGNVMTFTNKSGNISQWTNDAGYLTNITSGQVTTALGYTPANLNGSSSQYVKADGTFATLPSMPDQINLIAGQNTKITGTYPNITISDSSSVRFYNSSGRVNQSVFKIWSDILTPTTGNGYSVDISSAGISTIMSVMISTETNTGITTEMRNYEIKSYTTTAVNSNISIPNSNNIALLGLTLLGVPTFMGSGTGTKLHLTVIGY